MLRVALTGGIASGKTTVSNLFAELQIPVVDADILAREAVAAGSNGLRQVVERFGEQILTADNELNRAALREIVFQDPQARKDLEAIVHPQVRQLTQAAIQRHEAEGAAYCLIVVPLLVETGQSKRHDKVIVVDVDKNVQLDRLLKRDGSSEQQARSIIESQASREQRLEIADYIIDNSGELDLPSLRKRVAEIHDNIIAISNDQR